MQFFQFHASENEPKENKKIKKKGERKKKNKREEGGFAVQCVSYLLYSTQTNS